MKAKTRTNQPVYYFFESQQDMTNLSGSFLNSLVAGDIVVKQTGEQQHAYIVSYKQDGTGICMTYTDASCVETISYDYVGSNWVYNSTDVTELVDKDNVALLSGATFTGAISGTSASFSGAITGGSITENMSGYSFTKSVNDAYCEYSYIYAGVVKNGNKLTLSLALKIKRISSVETARTIGYFTLPEQIWDTLNQASVGGDTFLAPINVGAFKDLSGASQINGRVYKSGQHTILYQIWKEGLNLLDADTDYYLRIETTFLLSENLAQ